MRGPILWIGPVPLNASAAREHAVSPAATNWQRGLLRALASREIPVVAIGHAPAPVWPKGPFRVRTNSHESEGIVTSTLLPYENAPFARVLALGLRYVHAIHRALASKPQPRVIVTYNTRSHAIVGALRARFAGVPWLAVVADADHPWLETTAHGRFAPSRLADGRVYLSWQAYCDDPGRLRLHLDGGVVGCVNRIQPRRLGPVRVVYAGSWTAAAGVEFLARAWTHVRAQNVELLVCGKGRCPAIERLAAIDKRVKLLGFIDDAELASVLGTADVLLNPRPPSIRANLLSFPSKLPEYLAYGVPIVSTWTAGLHPRYRDVLNVADEEPRAFAQAIDETIVWDMAKIVQYRNRATAFVADHLLWDRQAARFLAFAQEVLGQSGDAPPLA